MKILIVKLGAIGDVIQCAAAVLACRDKYPDATITWVVGKTAEPLLRKLDIADEIIAVDESELFIGTIPARLASLIRLAWLVRQRVGYANAVFTAYSDWRYKLVTCLVRSNARVSLSGAGRNKLIQHRNRVYEYYRFLCGEADRIIEIHDLLRRLGDRLRSQIHSDHTQGAYCLNKEEYVLLVPGGAKNLLRSDAVRRWPLSSYVELTKRLLKKGYKVAIAGGAGDTWVCEAFSGLDVVDCIGKTNLLQMWNILDQASVIVAHDSGPLHLASTTGTSIIAIFGPTPPNAVVPLARMNTEILHAGNRLSCCPCYNGSDYAECNSPACMESISVDSVFNSVNALFQAGDKFCA